MTTTTPTLRPSLPGLELTQDFDKGDYGRIGLFTWDTQEGESRLLFGVWHDDYPGPLHFARTPGECREYITSGEAAAMYEQKRTEGEKP